jgi:hypothetical protein
MYVLLVAGRGAMNSIEIAQLVARRMEALGGSDAVGMRHLVAIENLGARGTRYSNQDFDVLSAAFRWASAI